MNPDTPAQGPKITPNDRKHPFDTKNLDGSQTTAMEATKTKEDMKP
jgi:hypothetical protein